MDFDHVTKKDEFFLKVLRAEYPRRTLRILIIIWALEVVLTDYCQLVRFFLNLKCIGTK